ncbi:MAG: peptidoglycan DD-metalloendopeptidase family protein [Chloroflexi bacterium]|nr:peptidoglycan DD-metalloendopeptidase family protein [Chloroflexota bacterium]
MQWQASNAFACEAGGSWSGSKPLNGSQNFKGFSSGSRTYSLTCSNVSGSTSRSVTVQIGYGFDLPLAVVIVPLDGPTSGQTTIQRSTYSLAGQAIATRVNGDPEGHDGLYYLYSDHLGSASALVTSGGQKVNETRYLPFGGYRSGGPNAITDRGFTGQKENMELGLLYYNARYYAPGLGRFLSADSIVPNPTNPQSYNRYSYVLNSPINYSDPSGHNPICNQGGSVCSDGANDDGITWTASRFVSTEEEYAQARAAAIRHYQKNFSYPFQGQQRLTSHFGQDHPDGVDWGGNIVVQAPAPGDVVRAGLDLPAGIWRIRHIETGEIREWSRWNGNELREINRGDDGLLEPERLLQTGEWEDIAPGWSHSRGTVMEIDHGHNLSTRYYHLAIDDNIRAGVTVDQGDVLAITENNGWSTGVHLHYGVQFSYGGQTEWLDPIFPLIVSASRPPQ